MNENGQDYFKALVEGIDGDVYVTSSDNTIEYVNQRVIKKFGRDLNGEKCFRAIHGLDAICPGCEEQAVYEGKTIKWERFESQTDRWYSYTSSPVYHGDGSISKLTLCIDITETRIAEEKLKESQRKFKTLLDNLPGMAYRCRSDENMTMEFASDGCYRLLGYKPEELIGETFNAYKNIVHPDDRPNLLEAVKSALAEKRPYSFIYRVKAASGQTIWVWEQGIGVLADNGRPVALEGFITNVTTHKKVELDLRQENLRLKDSIKERYRFGDILGKSPIMQKVYATILKAASSDANVIIYGESGTGKELVARSIQRLSSRKDKPFVVVNCGAISENLAESEFFGHKKGAFTSANNDKKGHLDIADGGTIFLDEIGEISLNIQSKLLRALEGGGYSPVGGNMLRQSEFRIIAATNKDLGELVKTGKMRKDFYYRIQILPIFLPPLRERKEDIPLLVEHFLKQIADEPGNSPEIPYRIMEAIYNYNWPGNVRELQSAIHRYLAFGTISFMENIDFDQAYEFDASSDDLRLSKEGLRAMIENFEKEIILKTLQKNHGHRQNTAADLKLDRKTLYRKLKAYGSEMPQP